MTKDFLRNFFGPRSEGQIELRSFLNESAAGQAPKRVFTRDPKIVTSFVKKWDTEGRGMFFGVATRKKGTHGGGKEDLHELLCLHVDIDVEKYELDFQDVLTELLYLDHRPTYVINSGFGLHAYWLFNEALEATPENIKLVEDANKALILALCGDPGTHDATRVMRLPGTHNTKEGVWRDVVVVHEEPEVTHELDDLVEWFDERGTVIERPVLDSDGDAVASDTTNPFSILGEKFCANDPIDVDARLEAMTHGGLNGTSIHETQLVCTASMASRGFDHDVIARKVMAATEKAAPASEKWDWDAEDKAIWAMIATAAKKFPPSTANTGIQEDGEKAGTPHKDEGDAAGDILAEGDANEKPVASSDELGIQLAPDTVKGFWDKFVKNVLAVDQAKIPAYQEDERRLAHIAAKAWDNTFGKTLVADGERFVWTAGKYWKAWDTTEEALVEPAIMQTFRTLGTKATPSKLSHAVRFFKNFPSYTRIGHEWNPSPTAVPCTNGIYDVYTGDLKPHHPTNWNSYCIGAPYDVSAGADKCDRWIEFLEGLLADHGEDEALDMINYLAEWIGVSLVKGKPRELRKALMVYGPSRTGKTVFASIVRALVAGEGVKTSAARLNTLAGDFGLSFLCGKGAWIADDAIGASDDLDDENFKVVVTGEPVSVNRKYKEPVEMSFDIPVLLTSNKLPRVKDNSDAVFNRSAIIKLTNQFPEEEAKSDIAEPIIEKELPGILLWALNGARAALKRGYFMEPEHLRQQRNEYKSDNNPAAEFLVNALIPDAHYRVRTKDIYAAFLAHWDEEQGHNQKPWSQRALGSSLKDLFPRAYSKPGKHDGELHRFWYGVKMTRHGLDLRQSARLQELHKGSGVADPDVNVLAVEAV